MRIAVLISGEYRTFGMCRPTMKFLDDARVDVYISTWDTTVYNVPKIKLKQAEHVSERIIRRDLGRDAVIEIESIVPFVETRYNSRMIHRWKRGIELIRNSGIEYDYILVMRPDLYFYPSSDQSFGFIEEFKDTLGSAWLDKSDIGFLNDVMFLSSSKKIIEMFDALSIQDWVTDANDDWHTWWHDFVVKYFPSIETLDMMARCTFCRIWVKEHNSITEIAQMQEDWSDLMVLQVADNAGIELVKKGWPAHVVERMIKKWKDGVYDKYTGDNI